MKKTFVIQVEYPDNDVIASDEVIEVAQECIEHYMELHFGANIMGGDYDRIKVKEVTDGLSLVRRMRDTQQDIEMMERLAYKWTVDDHFKYDVLMKDKTRLEDNVDEYLKKMEECNGMERD